MTSLKTLAIGVVGVAALAGASAPAAAQIYPGYGGYGGGYQYGYPTNTIGQVLQSILNPYGQFGYSGYGRVNPQVAIKQCTAAVQQRLAYQGGYGGGYASPYGYNNRYGGYGSGYGGYGNGYGGGQIVGITRVEQRSATTLRVRGYASTGMTSGYGGYGGYGAYGSGYAQPNLTFKCDVDYRGYVRDIDFNRRY